MKKHIKNIISTAVLFLSFNTGIAQILPPIQDTVAVLNPDLHAQLFSDCINFNNDATTNVLGEVNGDNLNPLGNWYTHCSGIQIDDNYTNGNTSVVSPDSSNFLIMYDYGCSPATGGGSHIWNNHDFKGNWIEKGHCLCYDFNVINNGNDGISANASQIRIYNGSNPYPYDATTNPDGSTIEAYFSLNAMPQQGSGWTSICPPIELQNSDGTLPSNAQGQWVMYYGTNTDWNNLITDVGGLDFYLDIGSSPTEVYGFDNFCFSDDCLPANTACCETDLAIWNVAGTPDPIYTTQQTNPDATIAYEQFEIHQSSTIPITELRVSITDIIYHYNYESCGKCESNPALWGSLLNPFNNDIGGLQFVPDSSGSNVQGNIIANYEGIRELVWRNPNGAMLQQGMTFPVWYLLPPVSDIPCCVTSVTICTKISWKDANCKVCEIYTCSNIELVSEVAKVTGGKG